MGWFSASWFILGLVQRGFGLTWPRGFVQHGVVHRWLVQHGVVHRELVHHELVHRELVQRGVVQGGMVQRGFVEELQAYIYKISVLNSEVLLFCRLLCG